MEVLRYIRCCSAGLAVLDDSGDAVVEYTYDAWGKHLTTTGDLATTLGAANPLTYRGYVYDRESTLYYLQSRYYDPQMGRFINADAYASTGQGLMGYNMFAYCACNPTRFSDSSGFAFSPCMVCYEPGSGSVEPDIPIPESRYSNFDEEDLYSQTKKEYLNVSKEKATLMYDTIKGGDYSQMLLLNPIPYFFGFLGDLSDSISLLYDMYTGASDLGHSNTYDPEGRVLYIGEGYNIITLQRVFIGDSYSAVETEYFIYDENWNLVYNDVLSDSYITD